MDPRFARRSGVGRFARAAADGIAAALARPWPIALAVVAMAASSGDAQSARRQPTPPWARTQVIARASADTVERERDPQPASTAGTQGIVDATTIVATVQANTDSLASRPVSVNGFRSRADSLTSVRTRVAADHSEELRIVISLNDRLLWALIGPDTLLRAPVAVSTDETLEYGGKRWTFETPRGIRTVLGKRANPVWIPPDWHYAEVAREYGFAVAPMKTGRTPISDGRWLEVRDSVVGVVDRSGEFAALPTDEEIIFDDTVFIPPVGTINREVEGELGHFMLDTGNGFLLHGTPHKASIGTAATHGCIRLRDDDIQWLYDMMPVGTRVYIY